MGGAPIGWILQFGAEHADAGQVAVAFGEIQAIADDKVVRNGEADKVGLNLDLAPVLFVQEHAGVQRSRFLRLENPGDFGEGVAGVENVVDEQDVLLGKVEADLVDDLGLGYGAVFVLVGRDAHAIEAHVDVELAQEVGGEHDGAIGDANDGNLRGAEIAVDLGELAAQLDNAAADRLLGDEYIG